MGLAFKPNIDDLRESPALLVATSLIHDNFNVLSVEPNVKRHSSIELYSIDEAVKQADILVYLVKHSDFEDLSISASKVVLDFCGVLEK